jgi:hypothetical protein
MVVLALLFCWKPGCGTQTYRRVVNLVPGAGKCGCAWIEDLPPYVALVFVVPLIVSCR